MPTANDSYANAEDWPTPESYSPYSPFDTGNYVAPEVREKYYSQLSDHDIQIDETELRENDLATKSGERYYWWQKRFHQVFANMRDSHEVLKEQEIAELLNKLIDISADGIHEARERDKMLSDIRKRQAETRRMLDECLITRARI